MLKFLGQRRNVGRRAPSLVEQGRNEAVASRSGCEHHMPGWLSEFEGANFAKVIA